MASRWYTIFSSSHLSHSSINPSSHSHPSQKMSDNGEYKENGIDDDGFFSGDAGGCGGGIDDDRNSESQSKTRKQKPNANTREEEFHQSPEAETAAIKPGMFHGLSKNGDKQGKPSTVFKEKSVEPENDFQSPTFGYKAPISSPSPCLSPEASPLNPRNINPSFDDTETPQKCLALVLRKPQKEQKNRIQKQRRDCLTSWRRKQIILLEERVQLNQRKI